MDAAFTLPYPEYIVAEELHKFFPKKMGYSLNLPLSRQQQGFDLLVYSSNSRKAARVQIKSSRSYSGEQPKRQSTKKRYHHNLWFNNFEHHKDAADFYILVGLYPKSIGKTLRRPRTPKAWWAKTILLFTDKEMATFLSAIKTKQEARPDRFFALGFDSDLQDIFLTRGASSHESYARFAIKHRSKDLKRFLR